MLSSMNIGGQTPQQNNEPLIFEVDEYDKYAFPYEDEVPEGKYYAMIMKVENSQNKYDDPCFDVCIKLLPFYQPQAWNNEQIDELTYHYVRQRYKKGTAVARRFQDDMHSIGLPKKFTGQDLEGKIAIVQLHYNNSKLGGIANWKASELNPTWFADDEEQDEEDNT